MLDGLVSGSILSVPHGVVREDEERRQLHERGQPYRGPRIVAEYEERRAERPQLGECHTIHDRRHPMLTNAKMQVLPSSVSGLEVSCTAVGQSGLVRGAKIGRTTKEP